MVLCRNSVGKTTDKDRSSQSMSGIRRPEWDVASRLTRYEWAELTSTMRASTRCVKLVCWYHMRLMLAYETISTTYTSELCLMILLN